jgi:hypothetical protein
VRVNLGPDRVWRECRAEFCEIKVKLTILNNPLADQVIMYYPHVEVIEGLVDVLKGLVSKQRGSDFSIPIAKNNG